VTVDDGALMWVSVWLNVSNGSTQTLVVDEVKTPVKVSQMIVLWHNSTEMYLRLSENGDEMGSTIKWKRTVVTYKGVIEVCSKC